MSVSNGQLANAATFNGAFVSKTSDQTVSGKLTFDKELTVKELTTPSTPASGYGKIYFKSDGKLYFLNDAGVEAEVGDDGSGSGQINFIANGNAESNNTTGWAVYADTAGTAPVDGTGGSANVTNTVSGSSPLFGDYSFLLAKDASNRQGQGWSYAFSIDRGYQAKMLDVTFEYLVSSGTFTAGSSSTDSDVTVWIYDVTNSLLIQPSNHKLFSSSSTVSSTFKGSFQASSNSTSYRVIFHVGSTSSSAYTLKVDNVVVSPSQYLFGAPVSRWESYTPTGSWTTNTTYTGKYRRIGDSIEAQVRIELSGAPGGASSLTSVSIPSGLKIDTSKLTSATTQNVRVGSGVCEVTNSYPLAVVYYDTSNVRPLRYDYSGDGSDFDVITNGITDTTPDTFGSGDFISLSFVVPIVGFDSTVPISTDGDNRIVSAAMQLGTSNYTMTDATAIVWNSAIYDTHGAFNGTDAYVVPVSGLYEIKIGEIVASVDTYLKVFKNSAALNGTGTIAYYDTSAGMVAFGSVIGEFVAGDQIKIVPETTTGQTLDYSAGKYRAKWSVTKLSGPQSVGAGELVACSYYATSNGTASSTAPINFAGKEFDTHSAVTTGSDWKFRAPIAGTYEVSVYSNASTGTAAFAYIYKNSTSSAYKAIAACTTTTVMTGSTLIKLNAGDTIAIFTDVSYPYYGNASLASEKTSHISIKKVGAA
jgi:hypothetical protein